MGYKAKLVVETLGGCRAVAERLRITPRAVQYWLHRPDGCVPVRYDLQLRYEELTPAEKRAITRLDKSE